MKTKIINVCEFEAPLEKPGWKYIDITNGNIKAMKFFDEGNGIIITTFYIYKSRGSLTEWEILKFPKHLNMIDCAYIFSKDCFFAISSSNGFEPTFLRSDDGGNYWFINKLYKDSCFDKLFINSIYFTNAYNGYLVGRDLNGAVIFVTDNGGKSWEKVYYKEDCDLNDIKFINNDIGIACGSAIRYEGDFLFALKHFSSLYDLQKYCQSFLDYKFFFPHIVKTEDGGKHWYILSPQILDFMQVPVLEKWVTLNQINFIDERIGFAVGSHSTFMKTEYGGNFWEIYKTDLKFDFQSVLFLNQSIGYAGGRIYKGEDELRLYGESSIIKTNDGGKTWVRQNLYTNLKKNWIKWGMLGSKHKNFSGYMSDSSNEIRIIYFIGDKLGFAAGNNGMLFMTKSGGE